MANQATTTYKVTGTRKAVNDLWSTLQKMEVNSSIMVNNSSKLIGYYDGREKGGTFYTIRKAMAQNIPIVNVY